MWNNPKILLNKKPNFKKLTDYGFVCKDGVYSFTADIMDKSFSVKFCVTKNGHTDFTVTDNEFGEEYSLVFNSDAVGSFVGAVRGECEAILQDIVNNCYETDIFKSEYTKLVINYVERKYGIFPEFLWQKTPDNAIFRKNGSTRWFAALLTVERNKIGIAGEGEIEIINLKETPKNVLTLLDNKNCLPAYHMNKKHWYTVPLDKTVPIEEIYNYVDKSYNLIK